jgi:hypothetical protein
MLAADADSCATREISAFHGAMAQADLKPFGIPTAFAESSPPDLTRNKVLERLHTLASHSSPG